MCWLIAGNAEQESVGRDQASGRRADKEHAEKKGQVTECVRAGRNGAKYPKQQNRGDQGPDLCLPDNIVDNFT